MITKLKIVECPNCHQQVKENELRYLPSGIKCCICRKKEKIKYRDFLLHDIAGIRRRSPNGTRKIPIKIEKMVSPKIKGGKQPKTPQNRSISLYITKEEKRILWSKFIKQMPEEEADKRVKDVCVQMENLIKRLREQRKTDKEINTHFKEEFAKLLERGC